MGGGHIAIVRYSQDDPSTPEGVGKYRRRHGCGALVIWASNAWAGFPIKSSGGNSGDAVWTAVALAAATGVLGFGVLL